MDQRKAGLVGANSIHRLELHVLNHYKPKVATRLGITTAFMRYLREEMPRYLRCAVGGWRNTEGLSLRSTYITHLHEQIPPSPPYPSYDGARLRRASYHTASFAGSLKQAFGQTFVQSTLLAPLERESHRVIWTQSRIRAKLKTSRKANRRARTGLY
jgi:hypothetical protein